MLQFLSKRLNGRLWLPLIVSTALLGGCGGSSDSDTDNGSLYISLTDAEGDFNQYTVDVTGLKLYRVNGAVIETLPNTTRLDFTQYIDVSEFLTTATVPAGIYEKAEITIDFDNAEITVEDADGNSIPGTPVDVDGNPLGSLTLTASINGGEGFVIRRGKVASLTVDFDLEASNRVVIDAGGDSATVTVEPILVASTDLDLDKTRRARGLLDSVNVAEQQFVLDIRPFQVRHVSHGELTVHVTDDSLYEIDGVSYTGDEGLNALAGLPVGTPVVALGRFDFDTQQYTADEIHAGSSVPWDGMDGARGSVIARDGNSLTLLGASIETGDGRIVFNDELTVLIDEDTRVYKQGSANQAGIADISIGQRISVLGQFKDDGTFDATGASDGVVRMKYTDLGATVVEKGNNLVVDLQSINHRSIRHYDFSGTGIDAANDADPNQYEVDTGSLPLYNIDPLDPVWIRGFPTSFGSAPPDFEAKTVIDVSNLLTKLFVSWAEGNGNGVITIDDNGLQITIDAADKHVLKRAGIVTDLNELDAVPTLVPGSLPSLYSISEGMRVEVYHRWDSFMTAVQSRLDEGRALQLVSAQGRYDPAADQLETRRLVLRFVNPTTGG